MTWPGSATKAWRIWRPTSVRIGMFWRLGSVDDRRPVCAPDRRSEEHTSELQSLMRISYAVFCLTKKKQTQKNTLQYQHIITHTHTPFYHHIYDTLPTQYHSNEPTNTD